MSYNESTINHHSITVNIARCPQQADNFTDLEDKNALLSPGQNHINYRIPVFKEFRQVAMKIVHLNDCRSLSSIETFLSLNHPNIVRLFQYDRENLHRYHINLVQHANLVPIWLQVFSIGVVRRFTRPAFSSGRSFI